MIVKVLGYKISLEIIILLLVIYLVMMVHALASCCNAGAIAEGFKNPFKKAKAPPNPFKKGGSFDKAGNDISRLGKLVENIII
jgi:hypothetical protein